jgi:excisionase family DNA binding protein
LHIGTLLGMKVEKAKRRLRGKQPKLNRQEAHLVSLVHSGEYSTAEVAELFGVGRSTVYRAIERQRIAAKAGLAGRDIATLTPTALAVSHFDTPVGRRRPDASSLAGAPYRGSATGDRRLRRCGPRNLDPC